MAQLESQSKQQLPVNTNQYEYDNINKVQFYLVCQGITHCNSLGIDIMNSMVLRRKGSYATGFNLLKKYPRYSSNTSNFEW